MKYKLLKNDKIEFAGRTLYRIRAIKEVGPIKEGDIGGYVENENILSQEGECWIGGDAKVFGCSKVSDKAKVYDEAIVNGSKILGNSVVAYEALVENSTIQGFDVLDNTKLKFVHLEGRGTILHNAVLDRVKLSGFEVVIGMNSRISSNFDIQIIKTGVETFAFCKDSVCGINVGNCSLEVLSIDDFVRLAEKTHDKSSVFYKYQDEAIAYAKIAKEVLK